MAVRCRAPLDAGRRAAGRAQGGRGVPAGRPGLPGERIAFMLADAGPACWCWPTRPAAALPGRRRGAGARSPASRPDARSWPQLLTRTWTDADRTAPLAAGAPGVRDLHLGLDRAAQGRGGHAPQRGAACSRRPRPWFGFGGADVVDAVPLLRVRLLGLGAVGGAAARRPRWWWCRTRSAARRGEFLRPAGRRAGDGAQPDAVGLLPADAGGRAGPGPAGPRRCAAWSSAARRWTWAGCGRGMRRHRGDAPVLVNMYGITETTVHVTELALDRPCGAGPARA